MVQGSNSQTQKIAFSSLDLNAKELKTSPLNQPESVRDGSTGTQTVGSR
jgi:hypothetical protein